MHIYDGRFPAAPNATLRPGDATPDDYRLLQKRIGIARNVHALHLRHRQFLYARWIDKVWCDGARRSVVDTGVTDAELKRLDSLGIRGIRFNLVQSGATTIEMLEPLSKRANELGWHVQIHMLGDEIVKIEDLLQRLPSPIVF
jgi:predicted TIM-barrel fold metal-dependent hydrolase